MNHTFHPWKDMCNSQAHRENQAFVMQIAQNQKFQHLQGWLFGFCYLPQKSNLLGHHPNGKKRMSLFSICLS